ncbi:hypothetical protein HYH02_003639 [Chlamydomonas schloesseri]|uniref:Uncharacterized protein n=1 Tax=Chlamydomonas schloesseri TaxID=2026947 RepID=A0A835WR70_9CHLO|nr:hypothetical protein HYH02_003639 [Chlamydomonas schloesseri]|eukprot:KAG2451863.1 hypothetical protein HYH02_003639 [Chlamydomonas schloesseri]
MAAGAAVGSAQLLAAAMSFTRRSTTQAGGSLLDSIGLPGEEHGAMYEALIIDDEEVLASPSAAAAAANAAAASLAARSAVEYGPASGAGAFASGGGGGGAGTAPAGQFMPRPPATPPPVPRGSVSGVHIDGGGGGGTGATAEPAAVSPVAARIRVHRGPIFNFGDLDRDGSGTGGGGGATPATSSGQAAVSPAAAAVGSGFVQAPPRFARASTTIGVSSAPLATPSRGTLLPAGEPPGDPAAYLARGASACGAAAGVCAPGGASGAATPTCAAAVSSGAVDLPGHAAGRKLLPPLQRAALHAQQTASPRVSLTGAGSGGLSPSAAAGPGPNSANVLGRGSVSGIGPATFGASGGGAAVPGLRAMSSSLTSPGSFSDLKCQVSVLCDDEAAGLIATSGPSPAAARANGGTAGLSSFALLSGAAQSGGKALHPPGRNSTGGNSGGGGPSARSNNDLINAAAAEIPAVEVGLALTPHGAGAGVIAGPLPSVDATATAAALSALAAHTSAHSPLPQAKTGDTSLGGSLSRPLLPHRRALTEVPALEAS